VGRPSPSPFDKTNCALDNDSPPRLCRDPLLPLGEGWAVGRFPGQFLRRTELIKRSLRLDDEPEWWCREPPQSVAACAAEVDNARASGKSVAYQTRIQQTSGVPGYSLFFAPSPAVRDTYLYLKHLWDMGPTAAPYETMHVVLLNVVPHLRRLFAGLELVNSKKDEDYIVPRAIVARIGTELRGARRTVPMAQERSLRNIDVHQKSLKAVHWMHFILCSGEVLLAGRIPSDYFDIFMALSRACRLLVSPKRCN